MYHITTPLYPTSNYSSSTALKKKNQQVIDHMCGFVQRGNYFGGELIRRTEVEMRVGKFKNKENAAKDEVTGEMVEDGEV